VVPGDQEAPSVDQIRTSFCDTQFFGTEARLIFLGGAHVYGTAEFGRFDAESHVACIAFSVSPGRKEVFLRNRQDVRRGRPCFLAV